jgi:hypothetical protein
MERPDYVITPEAASPKLAHAADDDHANKYHGGVIYLAPRRAASGIDVCRPDGTRPDEGASSGCTAGCLYRSGRFAIEAAAVQNGTTDVNRIERARIARTRFLFEDREGFGRMFRRNLDALVRQADKLGKRPCFRPNGLSDLNWLGLFPWLYEYTETVRFYDYTKVYSRLDEYDADEYHLTASWTERMGTNRLRELAFRGVNTAVPFRVCEHRATCRCPLPAEFAGVDVIDGDRHDYRFLDPRGVVVGLRAKGQRARDDRSGFVVDAPWRI